MGQKPENPMPNGEHLKADTHIAIALSSPAGKSSRAIIRLTGSGSIELVNRFCQIDLLSSKAYRVYQDVLLVNELPIPVFVYLMRSPYSYTKEDMIELHLPGSPYLCSQILSFFLEEGECQLAEAGEFTKRAFLNGRLDLIQAESVIRIIHAKTDQEYRKALDALSGRVTDLINPFKDELFELCRNLTVDIDFDEEEHGYSFEHFGKGLGVIKDALTKLGGKLKEEQHVHEAFKAILCGPVNAGKSTIFNQLVNEKASIVSSIKGTTRDINKRELMLDGTAVLLQDCPGWGEAVDDLDDQAQNLSQESIETSDLIVCVLDQSRNFKDQNPLKEPQWLGRCLILINKNDLPPVLDLHEVGCYFNKPVDEFLFMCLNDEPHILLNAISKKIDEFENSFSSSQLSARQQKEVFDAEGALGLAIEALEYNIGLDAVEFEIRRSLKCLSRVTGDEVDENIITSIFEGFCIGK